MVDPEAGAALSTGLLTDTFSSTGIEPVDLSRVLALGGPAPRRAGARRHPRRTTVGRSREVKEEPEARREQELAEARTAVAQAEAARRSAQEQAAQASQRAVQAGQLRERLEEERDELRSRLEALEEQVSEAVAVEETASRARDEQRRTRQRRWRRSRPPNDCASVSSVGGSGGRQPSPSPDACADPTSGAPRVSSRFTSSISSTMRRRSSASTSTPASRRPSSSRDSMVSGSALYSHDVTSSTTFWAASVAASCCSGSCVASLMGRSSLGWAGPEGAIVPEQRRPRPAGVQPGCLRRPRVEDQPVRVVGCCMARDVVAPVKASPGDRVAVLSPSFAAPGEAPAVHEQAMRRLTEVTGLVPVEYPTTRRLGASPTDRAADLNAAFGDPQVRAVLATIGGDDQITVVPHLDGAAVRADPKPFLGYSDNTNILSWLWTQGVGGFYGGSTQVQLGPGPAVDACQVASLRAALLTGGRLELTEPGESEDFGRDWADPAALTELRGA